MSAELEAYDFELPPSAIAQRPADRRSDARLLRWRRDGGFEHLRFDELVGLLDPRDLLVLNDTKVLPARLFGTRVGSGGRVEVLLLRPTAPGRWEAMLRPARRLRPGSEIELGASTSVRVVGPADEGTFELDFGRADVHEFCRRHGHVPLPPYIRRDDDEVDRDRYQTVFARVEGSVAAPTAGLHFDEELLGRLRAEGIETAAITLHVGAGTFRPLDAATLGRGQLHAEWREVPTATRRALAECRRRGGRVVAVGTTVCRALESLEDEGDAADRGETRLMIAPGHVFRYVDVLLTNFHLPRSSLLMLVHAFAGPRWREAYALALAAGYRFYSYGDANWIEAAP